MEMVTDVSKCHSEFVPSEHATADQYNLDYSREGGCFVTTKRALVFVFLAVGAILLAVLLMYFYGPNNNQTPTKEITPNNLEKLLLKTAPLKPQPTHPHSTLHPLHYKLQMHPTLQNNFTGTIEILLVCVNKTATITLNVEDLHINEASVRVVEQTKKQKLNIHTKNYDKSKFVYEVTLKTPLEANENYTIYAEFSGNISDDFTGIYSTTYSKNKTFIATNLQDSQARRVFPCLDDPTFRATFEISVARKTNMVAVSNMPLLESIPIINRTGWMWDHFKTSPSMPLQSVAFAVCECTSFLVDETAVAKVWTADVARNFSFAKENLRKIMTFLDDYFNTEFPLPKIDFVVVPNMIEDAVNGWGLVFFRASSILLEDNILKEHVFQQISSQLAQQWFGNLVNTNEWLTKGFALFISQLMLDKHNLLSGIHSNYLIKTLEPAFEQEEEGLTDKKVASLLRMLFDVIPKNTFKETLKVFLEKWRYKAALPKDFWGSFTYQLAKNLTVAEFAESWTNKSGYPLIHVSKINESVTDVVQTNLNNQSSKWPIPLSYTVSSSVNVSKLLWLTTEKTQIKLDQTSNETWVLFNSNETGFYRINYDKQNWELLQKELEFNFIVIGAENRAQILNDALELAAFDYLDYNTALNLTKYLVKENKYLPWAAAFESFEEISIVIANTHHQEIFKKYIVKLTANVYKALGVTEKTEETVTQTYLRNLILQNRCDVQEETCVNWAKRLYEKLMNSSETYLEMSLQGKIHIQYVPIVWKSLTHPVAINAGFKFLRSNWKRIRNVYFNNRFVLKAIFQDFLSRLSTTVDLEDLTTFYKKEEKSLEKVAPMLLKAVEKIKFRIQWSSKHLVEVVGWMKNNALV